MDQQPNIQLTPGNLYAFNYQGQPKNLRFRVQDQEGLHFDEFDPINDINWDIVIPQNQIASVNFQPFIEDDGITTGESDYESEDEFAGGKKRKRKTLKRSYKKSKKCKKSKKSKKMKKIKKTKKNK
jgi:hypothetical protein